MWIFYLLIRKIDCYESMKTWQYETEQKLVFIRSTILFERFHFCIPTTVLDSPHRGYLTTVNLVGLVHAVQPQVAVGGGVDTLAAATAPLALAALGGYRERKGSDRYVCKETELLSFLSFILVIVLAVVFILLPF